MLKRIQNWCKQIGIVLPLLVFFMILLIFSLERIAIRLFTPESFAGSFSSQTLLALLVGLRFDIVVAATIACPLIILIIAEPLLKKYRFLKFICALIAFVGGLIIFACIADFYFFQQFGERLNHKALVYLGSDYVYKIIWNEYPIIIIGLIFLFSIFVIYKMLIRFFSARFFVAGKPLSIFEIVPVCIVLVSLAVIGIRGNLGPKAINTGPAYFCSSRSISQLALNGIFTLREAIWSLYARHESLANYYSLLPYEEASKNTIKLILRAGDRLCPTSANPLRRITNTGRPLSDYNVVLVVLESLSWHYISSMGASVGYTPNLDKLMSQGLLMDQCFAVGNRTTRGFGAIVTSYPDLPGKSITTRSQSEGTFLTLASVLKLRGYETMFIYGGQPSYDHRQAFLGSNGYTRMVFKDDFAVRTFKSSLGYCDGDLYDQAHLEFQKCNKPFFATLLTLSFHRAFEIPPSKVAPSSGRFYKQIDAIRYTDWAIGRFMEKAASAPYFDKTIFVFVADHMGGFKESPATAASYRVPFLIYAPKIVEPNRISTVCSQLDVAPTIMHLLGGSYEHCFFGSSILNSPENSGFAWILHGQELIFIDGRRRGIIVSPGNHNTFFTYSPPDTLVELGSSIPADIESLSRMPISILQVAAEIFENSAYNLDHDIPLTAEKKTEKKRDLFSISRP